jgi:hypothetical protein
MENVHQDDVRAQRSGQIDCGASVVGEGDDLESRVGAEDRLQYLGEEGKVVRDQHRSGSSRRWPLTSYAAKTRSAHECVTRNLSLMVEG